MRLLCLSMREISNDSFIDYLSKVRGEVLYKKGKIDLGGYGLYVEAEGTVPSAFNRR